MLSTRLEYTHEERVEIVKYIVENNGYLELRGNKIWKDMEKQKVVNRTWQSMKQHFKTKIINCLHLFKITEEEKSKIRSGYNKTRSYKDDLKRSDNEYDKDINNKFSDEEDDVVLCNPGQKTFKKQKLIKYSNDDTTSKNLNTTITTLDNQLFSPNSSTSENEEIEFTHEEDVQLLNFFKKDTIYLQNREQKFIYQFFKELNKSSKSCESLMNRFNNHIIHNLQNYDLSFEDLLEISKYIEKKPSEIKQIEENKPISKVPIVRHDKEVQISELDIIQETKNCVYLMKNLKNEDHLLVSKITDESQTDNILEKLSKELSIPRKNIHIISSDNFDIITRENEERRNLLIEFKNIVSSCASLNSQQLPCNEIDILLNKLEKFTENIPNVLEISDTESINTQTFNPNIVSTQNSEQVYIQPKNEIFEINSVINNEIKIEHLNEDEMIVNDPLMEILPMSASQESDSSSSYYTANY